MKALFPFGLLTAIVLTVAAGVLPAMVAAAEPAQSTVTQTYGVDQPVQRGMVVQLADANKTKVEPVKQKNETKMYGVVVAANDAALTLTSDDSTRQVYVAANGRFDVLVSNQNGAIKAGDLVGASSVDGVAAKTTSSRKVILGRAVEDFSGTSNVVSSASLRRDDGKLVDVSIGRIVVDIAIAGNPLNTQEKTNSVTGIVQNITSTVSNKPVSPIRAYLSLILLLLTAIIAGSLLYSGVRSSISSIGRNPLAKKSILRGLFQVFLMSLSVLIVGLFGVYLLLKL